MRGSILGAFTNADIKKAGFDNQIENIHYQKIKRPAKNRSLRRIDELAEDIRENGLENNLLVRRIDDPEFEVELIGGERRFTAILQNIEAGDMTYEYIPCKVVILSDVDSRYRLIMNNHENDPLTVAEKLDAVEELKEIIKMKRASGEKIPGRIDELIANELGMKKSQVGNYNKILNNATEEVREQLAAEKISIDAALSLVDLSEEDQKEFVTVSENMSKKDVEDFKKQKHEEERQLHFNEEYEIIEDEIESEGEEEIFENEYIEEGNRTIEDIMTVIMESMEELDAKIDCIEFKTEHDQYKKIYKELLSLLDMFGLAYE